MLAGDTVVAVGIDGTRPPRRRYGYYGEPARPRTRVLTVDIADPASPRSSRPSTYDAGRWSPPASTATPSGWCCRRAARARLRPPGKGRGVAPRARPTRSWCERPRSRTGCPSISVDGGEPEQLLDCTDVAIPRDELGLDTMSVVGFEADDPADVRRDRAGRRRRRSPTSRPTTSTSRRARAPPGAGLRHLRFGAGTVLDDGGTTYVFDFEVDGTGATYVGSGEVEGIVRRPLGDGRVRRRAPPRRRADAGDRQLQLGRDARARAATSWSRSAGSTSSASTSTSSRCAGSTGWRSW